MANPPETSWAGCFCWDSSTSPSRRGFAPKISYFSLFAISCLSISNSCRHNGHVRTRKRRLTTQDGTVSSGDDPWCLQSLFHAYAQPHQLSHTSTGACRGATYAWSTALLDAHRHLSETNASQCGSPTATQDAVAASQRAVAAAQRVQKTPSRHRCR